MEDVSYMKEQGETETHVIFVDSSQRDTTAYPNPADYSIPFDEPLRNVVGVDVLDSVVPSTMYVVDEHNYDVRMYFISTTVTNTVPKVADVPRHIQLEPHLPSYLKWWLELETDPDLDAYSTAKDNLTSRGNMDIIDERISIGVDGNGTPLYESIVNLVDVPTLVPYQRQMGVRDISAYVAGAGETPLGFTLAEYAGVRYWIPTGFGFGTERSIIDVDPQGRVVMVTLAYALASLSSLRIGCHRLQFPKGNYSTLANMMTAAATGGGGTTAATTTGTPSGGSVYISSVSTDPDQLLQVRINTIVWSEFLGGKTGIAAFDLGCGMAEVLGFNGSLMEPSVVKLTARGNRGVKKYATNQLFGGTPSIYLLPKGIVNMTGERYIILRCIEVEAGMFSQSSTGSRGTGIGLFKLPVPGSLREQRQDYVTVVKRPFHPIGRMDSLTLRMERGRKPGELYNFKGVNHLIVMAIKVLVPKRYTPFRGSVLNPNYDNDFIRYTLNNILRDEGRPGMSAAEVETAMRRHELLVSRETETRGPTRQIERYQDSDSESETDSDSESGPYARPV
jgi:Family of unknown function (DUF5901)